MSDATDRFFAEYISRYLSGNRGAAIIKSALDDAGVELMPFIDHCDDDKADWEIGRAHV